MFNCIHHCRAEKEGKREKKQIERNKREAEKEKKRFDMELQKEKLQSVSFSFQPNVCYS